MSGRIICGPSFGMYNAIQPLIQAGCIENAMVGMGIHRREFQSISRNTFTIVKKAFSCILVIFFQEKYAFMRPMQKKRK
jgi:hypothetical protein